MSHGQLCTDIFKHQKHQQLRVINTVICNYSGTPESNHALVQRR
jgi:hypothetical protein